MHGVNNNNKKLISVGNGEQFHSNPLLHKQRLKLHLIATNKKYIHNGQCHF